MPETNPSSRARRSALLCRPADPPPTAMRWQCAPRWYSPHAVRRGLIPAALATALWLGWAAAFLHGSIRAPASLSHTDEADDGSDAARSRLRDMAGALSCRRGGYWTGI